LNSGRPAHSLVTTLAELPHFTSDVILSELKEKMADIKNICLPSYERSCFHWLFHQGGTTICNLILEDIECDNLWNLQNNTSPMWR